MNYFLVWLGGRKEVIGRKMCREIVFCRKFKKKCFLFFFIIRVFFFFEDKSRGCVIKYRREENKFKICIYGLKFYFY